MLRESQESQIETAKVQDFITGLWLLYSTEMLYACNIKGVVVLDLNNDNTSCNANMDGEILTKFQP